MESTHESLELSRTDRIGLIARELREPIANVLERLEQVLSGADPLTAKQRILLSGARDCARHLRETIQDVQEAARLQDGKPRLQMS